MQEKNYFIYFKFFCGINYFFNYFQEILMRLIFKKKYTSLTYSFLNFYFLIMALLFKHF